MDSGLLWPRHLLLQRIDPVNDGVHRPLAVLPDVLVAPEDLLRANVRRAKAVQKRLLGVF